MFVECSQGEIPLELCELFLGWCLDLKNPKRFYREDPKTQGTSYFTGWWFGAKEF